MQHQQGRLRWWLVALAFQFAWATDAGADAGAELAARAREVLSAHCASCHGGAVEGAERGGFDQVLNLPALVRGSWVRAGKPEQSELYRRMRDGEMPPTEVRKRPTAVELAEVRAWIAAGAPTARARELPSSRQLASWMAADLRRLTPGKRRHTRYIAVAHLSSAVARRQAWAAVSKLLNSLSWRPRLHRPVSIGGGALMRIDLRAIGWSRARWDRLARRAPTASVGRGGSWREVHISSGSYAPMLLADWLVHEASSPARYHELLSVPSELRTLRGRLGLSSGGGRMRAGFNGSGVSQHNRLIEREALPNGGYYWRSYDFGSSQGPRNLFENPLGPEGRDVVADGSEVIFSLPNRLQGYMLVGRDGRRIEQAPTSIVVDRRRPDSAVRNGVSCMGCHDGGILPKRDQIREHVLRNRAAYQLRDRSLVRRVLALHPPVAVLDRVFARDRARFAAALAELGVSGEAGEPIEQVARDYERDLGQARAARELGLERGALADVIIAAGLRARLGALLDVRATVVRKVWDLEVPRLLEVLGRTHLDRLPVGAELDLVCQAGSGADCFRLADRFYRGRGIRPDRLRALRLYRASCRRDYGPGCTAVGLMTGPSSRPGLPRELGVALWSFSRGCKLGHARGCERLGRMLLAGDGVAKDRARARRGLERACRMGRLQACTTAGNLRYHGVGGAVDYAAALGLYLRACAGGVAGGCRNAGFLYRRGHGTKANGVTGAAYLSRACRLRDLRGCELAGDFAAEGRGVKRDPGLAAHYYQRACDLGSGVACRKLARQYRWGKGVGVDWVRSERLFRRACSLGTESACGYL